MDPIRHLIFDCDGVLIDSEVLVAHAISRLKTDLGFPITPEEQLHKFVGLGATSPVVQAELAKLPATYPAQARAVLWATFERDLKPIPGIHELLDRLTLPFCVASSSNPERLHYTLGLTGLLPRFEGRVFSGSQVPRGKPYPDLFLFVAHSLRWAPQDCLVIEDSLAGVTAAKAARMQVIGFTGGSHLKDDPNAAQRLKSAGAKDVISTLDALRQYL